MSHQTKALVTTTEVPTATPEVEGNISIFHVSRLIVKCSPSEFNKINNCFVCGIYRSITYFKFIPIQELHVSPKADQVPERNACFLFVIVV